MRKAKKDSAQSRGKLGKLSSEVMLDAIIKEKDLDDDNYVWKNAVAFCGSNAFGQSCGNDGMSTDYLMSTSLKPSKVFNKTIVVSDTNKNNF